MYNKQDLILSHMLSSNLEIFPNLSLTWLISEISAICNKISVVTNRNLDTERGYLLVIRVTRPGSTLIKYSGESSLVLVL